MGVFLSACRMLWSRGCWESEVKGMWSWNECAHWRSPWVECVNTVTHSAPGKARAWSHSDSWICPALHTSPWIKGPLQSAVRWKKKWQRKEMLLRSTHSIYFPVFMVWGASKMQIYTLFCVVMCNFGKKSAGKDADFVLTKQCLCLVTILLYSALLMSLKNFFVFHA